MPKNRAYPEIMFPRTLHFKPQVKKQSLSILTLGIFSSYPVFLNQITHLIQHSHSNSNHLIWGPCTKWTYIWEMLPAWTQMKANRYLFTYSSNPFKILALITHHSFLFCWIISLFNTLVHWVYVCSTRTSVWFPNCQQIREQTNAMPAN